MKKLSLIALLLLFCSTMSFAQGYYGYRVVPGDDWGAPRWVTGSVAVGYVYGGAKSCGQAFRLEGNFGAFATPHFYAGAGIAANMGIAGGSNWVPVYLNDRLYFTPGGQVFYLDGKVGAAFGSKRASNDYKYAGLYFAGAIGYQLGHFGVDLGIERINTRVDKTYIDPSLLVVLKASYNFGF